MGYVYLGEAAGGRLLRYGSGYTQIGGPYQLVVATWPHRPMGDAGDAVFRRVTLLLRHTLGYNVRVTPIVDGKRLVASTFSGGPPAGGAAEETVQCPCAVFRRGSAVAAEVETLSLLGETEIVDVQVSLIPIREEV